MHYVFNGMACRSPAQTGPTWRPREIDLSRAAMPRKPTVADPVRKQPASRRPQGSTAFRQDASNHTRREAGAPAMLRLLLIGLAVLGAVVVAGAA